MDIHEDDTIFLAYRERMDLQSLKEAMQILRTTEGLGGVRIVLKVSSNVFFFYGFSHRGNARLQVRTQFKVNVRICVYI